MRGSEVETLHHRDCRDYATVSVAKGICRREQGDGRGRPRDRYEQCVATPSARLPRFPGFADPKAVEMGPARASTGFAEVLRLSRHGRRDLRDVRGPVKPGLMEKGEPGGPRSGGAGEAMARTRTDAASKANATSASGRDGPNGLVFDIQGHSVHDGPGTRTTVFLAGCPLSCGWAATPRASSRSRSSSGARRGADAAGGATTPACGTPSPWTRPGTGCSTASFATSARPTIASRRATTRRSR